MKKFITENYSFTITVIDRVKDGKRLHCRNAGDMNCYPVNDWNFIPNVARQNACGKTMTIVCFAIAPDYCGKGIATTLLERVITDAKDAGYIAVEGYGEIQNERVSWDFHGPIRLFEKAGFVEVARCDGKVVMRYEY